MKNTHRAALKIVFHYILTTVQITLLSLLVLTYCNPARATGIIKTVATDRAEYSPAEHVVITVQLDNSDNNSTVTGVLTGHASYLGNPIQFDFRQRFLLKPGASAIQTFEWLPPQHNFRGYGVYLTAKNSEGATIGSGSTAVDVSSTWLKFPRYGYLTDFSPESKNASSLIISDLNRFHINSLQFYDWQFKHQNPLAGSVQHPASEWPNLASTASHPIINSRQTILNLIYQAHKHGMAAMNYNLLYGAWKGYEDDGVSKVWGLFKKTDFTIQDSLQLPSSWQTDTIYLFNPANSAWDNYLIGQEQRVFEAYPFDGWHVDQVGKRGAEYTSDGQNVNLKNTFAPFLDAASSRLKKTIVFNNVGGYGLASCASSSSEGAVYVECWEGNGQKTYADLKEVVDEAELRSHNSKAVILAAYMDYNYAKQHPSQHFCLPGLLLTDAAIFACGGSHIELGNSDSMLCSEYFPNHSLSLTSQELSTISRYYDFLVAYENLLRGDLRNSANVIQLKIPQSDDASPETVWTFAKTDKNYQMLNLINLVGEKSNEWRDTDADYPMPTFQQNIAVKYYYGSGTIKSIYVASPDTPEGRPHPLQFRCESDEKGKYVLFTLPTLSVWDMVYLKMSK